MAEDKEANTPQVVWNDADMRSTYANVCNVSSTREEVIAAHAREEPIVQAERFRSYRDVLTEMFPW